jgi:AcrR family transcriptional regulator
MDEKLKMKIGQLEKVSGMPRSTIHHYLREGLLHPPQKTGKTMAYYEESHLERLDYIQKIKLDFLKKNKRTRIPIDLIKEKIEGPLVHQKEAIKEEKVSSNKKIERKERKKLDFIKIALRLYIEKGYYQTNLRDIAFEAGLSPSALYLYFTNKRELFAEVIEYVVNKTVGEMKEGLKNETNQSKRMEIMARIFSRNYPVIAGILNQLRAGAANNDEWARGKLKMIYEIAIGFLSKELERGMTEGRIRKTDPVLLALFIMGGSEIMAQVNILDFDYKNKNVLEFSFDCFQRIIRP